MRNKFPKTVKKIIFEGYDNRLKDKVQKLFQAHIPNVEISFQD